ncbi:MAG: NADH-quinone oxidoreductase subunit L [Myxococcales bacterium]|nr:NADH-quinone oxidoreductase subunit L [Myxococcales bacterium]USN50860.1 MAG: NADH-quinone oxidoreductase subunit L [Myxococcales bacterium]
MITPLLLFALPFVAALLILFFGAKIGRVALKFFSAVGIFSSATAALYLLAKAHAEINISQKITTWIPAVGNFQAIDFLLRLDSLSLSMCVVVSFVSFFIVLYAIRYMEEDPGVQRFFVCVNMFVAFMLLLVLADNLLLLFLGWEGVGVCSYMLIGFYFREPDAQKAAIKAFLVTRMGDVFLLFAIIICYGLFGTLTISSITEQAFILYPNGSILLTIAALCFLGGAVGKSAQLPLQTWLADAMWGPTPVSALIHAATMVTAGIYLIARLSKLFELSPLALSVVLFVGAATLIFAGIIASIQSDMKKTLAYSTMSQLGYMFLALGMGAYQAAVFHLGTHAFFKALLFLSAGVIGHTLHTYDLRKMGGLRKNHPPLFWFFMIGSLNLMGMPLITAGFFSKEWILSLVSQNTFAWGAGVFGVFLTGFYTCRMLVLAFYGQSKTQNKIHLDWMMAVPLGVLAVFSVSIGWLETPHIFGNFKLMSHWLSPSIANSVAHVDENILMFFVPTLIAAFGALLAIVIYGIRKTNLSKNLLITRLKNGGGFEELYSIIFILPYRWLAKNLACDLFFKIEAAFLLAFKGSFALICKLHSEKLSSYISFLILAALVMAGSMVVL